MKKKLFSRLLAGTLIASVVGMGGAAQAAPADPSLIDETKPVSLTIHKLSGVKNENLPHDGNPLTGADLQDYKALAGATFEMFRVQNFLGTDPATWTQAQLEAAARLTIDPGATPGAVPTAIDPGADLADPADDTSYSTVSVGDLTTDANGEAKFPALARGIYVVKETAWPDAVEVPSEPFLVILPFWRTTTVGAGEWLYDVHTYPKNKIGITSKELVAPAGGLGIGSEVTWKLGLDATKPPADDLLTQVEIHDVLDPRLVFDAADLNDVQAYAVDLQGNRLSPALVRGVDYTVATDTVQVPVDPADPAVTETRQRVKFAVVSPATFPGARFEVDFNTSVIALDPANNNTVDDGGTIKNTAIGFINDPNFLTDGSSSPEVSVKWGAVQIDKFDVDTPATKLQGAQFQVFDTKAKADACVAARTAGTPTACVDFIEVTRDNAGGAVAAQSTFTTDATGAALIPGLYVGSTEASRDYWLVETVAPTGYVLPTDVQKVTVTPGGNADVTVKGITNKLESPFTLPFTGAEGTRNLMIAAAVALMAGAGFLVLGRKKQTN
ncbi:MAG: SpaH/EbpB family LPXTG-anchored major pilin [Ancrocorticia sp.]